MRLSVAPNPAQAVLHSSRPLKTVPTIGKALEHHDARTTSTGTHNARIAQDDTTRSFRAASLCHSMAIHPRHADGGPCFLWGGNSRFRVFRRPTAQAPSAECLRANEIGKHRRPTRAGSAKTHVRNGPHILLSTHLSTHPAETKNPCKSAGTVNGPVRRAATRHKEKLVHTGATLGLLRNGRHQGSGGACRSLHAGRRRPREL